MVATALTVLVGVIALVVYASVHTVPPEHAGIVMPAVPGAPPLQPGRHFVSPLRSVIDVDMRKQYLTTTVSTKGADGTTVSATVHYSCVIVDPAKPFIDGRRFGFLAEPLVRATARSHLQPLSAADLRNNPAPLIEALNATIGPLATDGGGEIEVTHITDITGAVPTA